MSNLQGDIENLVVMNISSKQIVRNIKLSILTDNEDMYHSLYTDLTLIFKDLIAIYPKMFIDITYFINSNKELVMEHDKAINSMYINYNIIDKIYAKYKLKHIPIASIVKWYIKTFLNFDRDIKVFLDREISELNIDDELKSLNLI